MEAWNRLCSYWVLFGGALSSRMGFLFRFPLEFESSQRERFEMKKVLGICCLALFVATCGISMVGCGPTSAGDAKANKAAAEKAAKEKEDAVMNKTVGQPPK